MRFTVIGAQEFSTVDSSSACENQFNGSIQIQLLEDQMEEDWILPFDVDWQNMDTGNTGSTVFDDFSGEIANLDAGEYEVKIDLSDFCILTLVIAIEESELPFIDSSNITPTLCNGGNGSISLVINGGIPPYEIIWSNGEATSSIEELPLGTYAVTISDSLGCEINETYEVINIGDPIEDILLTSNINCICEGQPAQSFLLTSENEDIYSYEWSGPNGYTFTQQNPNNITEAGTYIVLVTNAYECTVSLDANIPACTPIESLEFEIIQSCGEVTGSILTTVTGGTFFPWGGEYGYIYEWSNAATGYSNNIPNLYNKPAGTYNLTVTDSEGCSITGEAIIPDAPDFPALTVSPNIEPACTPSTGSISLNITGTLRYPMVITRCSRPGI